MDEPLSNLDAKLRNQMRHSILNLHKQLGTTFVYVTHDQTEAMTMGDHIVLFNEGHIVQQGSPKEMYTNPNHIFVAGFIGNPPANIITTDFGYVSIRPEDIQIVRDLSQKKEKGIELAGTVNVSEPMGSDILYDVKTKLGRLHVKGENSWENIDNHVLLYIPSSKILYFNRDGERIYQPQSEEKIFMEG